VEILLDIRALTQNLSKSPLGGSRQCRWRGRYR